MSDIDPFSADAFRRYEHAFKAQQRQNELDYKHEVAKHRSEQVDALIKTHVTDEAWAILIAHAKMAAAHGAKEYLLLRFPSDLLTDGSRAINNPPNDAWPETLRGEALELYQRWNTSLRSHGFHIAAQVLDFPNGKPGDVGLFLRWGE